MAQYTDDPVADFEAHDREQERKRDLLPRCTDCNKPIEDDRCWCFYDEPMCDTCAEKYRKDTADLMGW